MSETRKRVLLFAEAVTLAHVARPLAFARALPVDRFEVAIATDQSGAAHVSAAGIERIPLSSINPKAFLQSLSAGRPLYDEGMLNRYVENDLQVIDSFRPDLIIGDFRLSLSVSARVTGIAYATIASAYWSPYYTPPRWPVPALPLTRWLPIGIAQPVFQFVRPLAFRVHCGPLNAVRRRFGLPDLARDLRRIYTDADHVLYSDLPSLFELRRLPATHEFLGPVLWEPAVTTPDWWNALPDGVPIVYVTLGSSGDAALLPRVVAALAPLPISVMVAAAGRSPVLPLARNVFTAPYLPGLQAARRASLVVCNGGSLTAYQALASGVPVLGIASNLDQFLNMQAICTASAGELIRADRFSLDRLVSAVRSLLENGRARAAAGAVATEIRATEFQTSALRFAQRHAAGAQRVAAG